MDEIIARYGAADLRVIRDFLDRVAEAAARAGRSPGERVASPTLHYHDDILIRARTQAEDT